MRDRRERVHYTTHESVHKHVLDMHDCMTDRAAFVTVLADVPECTCIRVRILHVYRNYNIHSTNVPECTCIRVRILHVYRNYNIHSTNVPECTCTRVRILHVYRNYNIHSTNVP